MEFDAHNLLAIAVGAFFIGFFKSTFSMACGILLVPFMVMFWPTRFVLGLISVLMWATDYVLIRMFWRQWEGRLIKLVVPGFIGGILIGTTILVALPDFWIKKLIGLGCLVFVVAQGWGELRGGLASPRVGPAAGVGVGLVGGTVSALTHSGGIVLTLYFLSQGIEKTSLVASILVTWLWVNPVKMASYWVGGLVNLPLFLACVAMVPLSFLGGWLGKRLLDRIPQRAFNLTLLALSAVAGARLLWV